MVPAAEIAAALELPLDVVISRKIGALGNPELAIGAVAEDGPPYLSEHGGMVHPHLDADRAAGPARRRARASATRH